MAQNKYTVGFILAVLIVGTFSCRSDDELPAEPVITEIWFDKAESNLMIRFTDGDGDVGLEPWDTIPPFQELEEDGTPNFFHYNLHVDVFYREAGEWLPIPLDEDAIGYKFRIPDLTPQGQNKQLRVLVTWDFSDANNEILTPAMDTVMYRAVLVDRALNVSNEAETEPVIFSN